MGRPIFLLGAGASIDAGLHDTNRLTREIYKTLKQSAYKVPVQIFGYVISKIISRKVRLDGSPYDEVNVEEVYDGVERLLLRDNDIVSEFVSSWDPFLDALKPSFNRSKFVQNLERGIIFDDRTGLSGRGLRYDSFRLDDAAREIEKAISNRESFGATNILPTLIGALLKCLQHKDNSIGYMENLLKFAAEQGSVIASLNYDLVAESAMANLGVTHDYGLSQWNSKKLAGFTLSRADIKLIKLHGSMNWSSEDDNINIVSDTVRRGTPLMIFGGANGKLRADGPFLQLRHEFEKRLLSTNILVIIGYAFADEHLNAIIRRWTSTRRKSKLIIVDPNRVVFHTKSLGAPFKISKGKITERTVDLIHIKKTAANSIDDVISSIKAPIDLKIPDKDGVIPQIWIKTIS